MFFIPECCICGKEQKKLVKIIIEDGIVDVCDSCSSFGKIVSVKTKKLPIFVDNEKYDDFEIIENFGEVIKKSREKLGIERKDFALKIKESEKIIKKIEAGQIKPDNNLIKKIEKELDIKLVEKVEQKIQKKDFKNSKLTIGDIVQID